MEKKAKVLIVDNSAEMRDRLVTQLGDMEEIEICGTAANGMSALDMVESLKPDILLLDIIMPQLDGYGVMEYLAEKNEETPSVIVMSALSQENFVMRALELGAKYYLAKPFDTETLKRRIRNVMEIDMNRTVTRQRRRVEFKPVSVVGSVCSVEEKISTVFITIGIPAHIKGYHFLREAVKMVVANPDSINRITKELYPGIAKHFGTSPSKVERAIRHAIEVAWTRGKIENINNMFGYTVYSRNDKPTNGEFIALIADKLIIEKSA